ncbi:TonB-dependent receptor domain-containing protein [Salinimicrobium terrae]|uniref:TonB-dependent receptor domain-containing protein n=1 Tax=Salinimicrobium terrae TaxID=470866 RepID=UPI00049021D7|nr:TonB-dependent receptor [Salinimicrobium terrae]
MTLSKVFNLLFILFFIPVQAQYVLDGQIISAQDGSPVPEAEVYNNTTGELKVANQEGKFRFEDLKTGSYELTIFSFQYEIEVQKVDIPLDESVKIELSVLSNNLSEVVLTERRKKLFSLRNLRQVEGTAIYSGKKSEVVLLEELTANLATNNARQIYSQVVGLNIYDNGDAGLQLNIGGRGLDPNRTQNFNTRQNDYDISADVLGYPESYYTPPAEALSEIQVVRGAASLQYGTQFGGLINFKFKQPSYKKFELISRQSTGSYNLFTSFNSLSGTLGNFSYYTYYNYKTGEGFRPNSEYDSHNAFVHLGYRLGEGTKLSFEYTLLDYLAQQPGGLTDAQFYRDPSYSNRSRNWFDVNWNLLALKLEHKILTDTDLSLNIFGLDASRKAVGYRENRVSQPDDPEAPRELLSDEFNYWGAEARILTRYDLFEESVFLIGTKYYKAKNLQQQGPGTTGSGPDFSFATAEFPNYSRQSNFEFPNENIAVFGENIFNFTNKLSLTPGFRFEYINTESRGTYRDIFLDLAGNVLKNEALTDNRGFERSFVLLGVGAGYEMSDSVEIYANFSQNYRSVTFSDIRVVNPVFQVDPNITDETGFTSDVGIRGRWRNILSYDASIFGLKYNDRIGEVLRAETRENFQGEQEETGRVIRFRGNIGDAFIYGLETFADWNLQTSFFPEAEDYMARVFVNSAFTSSEYIQSEQTNVEGNKVEFIPAVNLKTGLNFGYRNMLGALQYTYLSKQFSDATNAPQNINDSQRGIEGVIPAYGILDLSLSYSYHRYKIESGINNLLDNIYFTRRATGYPGPGIIPAQPLTWYVTLQVRL